MPARLLVIAGSDSSGGAGIQADLKTAFHFGVYAQTAITAITVQNTRGVSDVHAVPAGIVRAQIAAALNDIGADAIKIGMLGSAETVAAVADALTENDSVAAIPLVLDPVLASSSGEALLDQAGMVLLKKRLLRRATLVTPNWPECEALTGMIPLSEHRLRNAAMVFKMLGCDSVLFKGGHAFDDPLPSSPAREPAATASGEEIVRDVLWSGGEFHSFEAPRQHTPHTHGTGCTLATAIACGLAQGMALFDAAARAHAYVQEAIRTAPGLGGGNGPLNHQ